MKYYFTFGQTHVHKINGITFDKDCVVEIEASDPNVARNKIFFLFRRKWSMIYEDPPNMDYFPRGIIKI